jgi:hypothetical protein
VQVVQRVKRHRPRRLLMVGCFEEGLFRSNLHRTMLRNRPIQPASRSEIRVLQVEAASVRLQEAAALRTMATAAVQKIFAIPGVAELRLRSLLLSLVVLVSWRRLWTAVLCSEEGRGGPQTDLWGPRPLVPLQTTQRQPLVTATVQDQVEHRRR